MTFPPVVRLKLDPGSKTTGLALIREISEMDDATGQVRKVGEVLWAAELSHRSDQIQQRLAARGACRRARRYRHTRYRPARFQNRRRQEGWLAPSLESRVWNVVTWVKRLQRLCQIGAISLELVKFDPRLLHHPEISGIGYQQGELMGYEVREYLLEKWGRRCAYCNATNVPL